MGSVCLSVSQWSEPRFACYGNLYTYRALSSSITQMVFGSARSSNYSCKSEADGFWKQKILQFSMQIYLKLIAEEEV
jgi:hypothetical protein